ncbi:MAG: TonB-dependent receptor [Cetobacterium sp.]
MKKHFIYLGLVISALSHAMEPSSEGVYLEKSVISTLGYEQSLQNTTKNIQIITKEEISEKNFKDITEVLESSPLITITRNSVGESIQMRGSGLNSKATVQVLVDGAAINPVDINHGTLPLNSVSVSSIEKIEILPGGNGVLYGDGFTGGLVNIITKSSVDKTGGYVGFRYGSDNERRFETGTSVKVNDNLAFIIDYSKEDNDTNRDYENTKNEHFNLTSLLKLSEDDKLKLQYTYYNKKSKTAELLTKAELDANASQSGVDFNGSELGQKYSALEGSTDQLDRSNLTRNEFSMNYDKNINSKLSLNLNMSYQENKNDVKTKESTYANFGTMIDYREYYANNIGTFTDEKFKINPSVKYEYGNDSYLILGYDYKLQKSKRDFENFMDMYKVYNLDSEKESHGIYAFNKTSIDKLQFLQGVRREWTKFDTTKNSHYYHRVTPGFINGGYVDSGLKSDKIKKSMRNDSYEFAINYLYSDTGNIYTRFEQSFRTPAPTEFQDKVDNVYAINDLKAETNQTIEIGLKDYAFGSFISLNAFAGKTKDEIYYEEVTHGKHWTYSNLDETKRKGFEMGLEQSIGKFVFFENLAFVDATISSDSTNRSIEGNYVPYTPKTNANIGTAIYFTDAFNTALTLNYKDQYYLDKENKYKAKDTLSLDLSVNYTLNNGLKLFGGINNLLDRQNFDQEGISNGEQVYDPSSGRTFYSGFKYTF